MNNVAHKLNRSSRTKNPLVAFTLSVFLLSAGYFVWPGCAIVPLPSKRVPISAVTTKQVKKLDGLSFTRDEIELDLGRPTEFYPEFNVACYSLNRLDRSRLMLLLCVLPVGWFPDKSGVEVALIQYDEKGRVVRTAVRKRFPTSGTLRELVQKWSSARASGAKESH